jgi:hypothetical protein
VIGCDRFGSARKQISKFEDRIGSVRARFENNVIGSVRKKTRSDRFARTCSVFLSGYFSSDAHPWLWVLNVENMQAIQSGFYLSHDKVCGMIRNIFGQPTLRGSIGQKTILQGVLVAFKNSGLKFSRLFLEYFFHENIEKNKLIKSLFILIGCQKIIFIVIWK